MKKTRRDGFLRALRVICANGALLIIIAGLYFSLLLSNGRGYASSAVPAGAFSIGNSAIYRGKDRKKAAIIVPMLWNAGAADAIFKTIRESGGSATVAVTENWANENGESIKKLVSEGFEIAVMDQDADKGDANELDARIKRTLAAVEAASGIRPKLFYCGSERRARLIKAAKNNGLITIIGSIDLMCVRGDASEIAARAVGNVKGGDIVVLAPSKALLEALPKLMAYFSSMGLTSSTVSGTIYD